MGSSSPKFSIIVPIYNVELYLEDCIQSVLDQSFQSYELICVNDGSTDSSLEILKS
ncbi:glycosyltransferase, partial [Klebsiella pneumoniae]|nr:glycosyltransferase [Klebsiella pneumoniae]